MKPLFSKTLTWYLSPEQSAVSESCYIASSPVATKYNQWKHVSIYNFPNNKLPKKLQESWKKKLKHHASKVVMYAGDTKT